MKFEDLPTTDLFTDSEWRSVLLVHGVANAGLNTVAYEVHPTRGRGMVTPERIVRVDRMLVQREDDPIEDPDGECREALILVEAVDGWLLLRRSEGLDEVVHIRWTWDATREGALARVIVDSDRELLEQAICPGGAG